MSPATRAALAALAASTVRWTFWPSLAAIALILAFGKPILWLFGPDFQAGYPLMFILAVALAGAGRGRPRRAACSTCWASSAAARWSMPRCSR